MQVALINLAVFLSCIGLGIVYTLCCKQFSQWQSQRLYQNRLASFKLGENTRLISVNLSLLCLVNVTGIALFQQFFDLSTPSVLLFILQFALIAVLDDLEFYWWHRFLHSHPWMMRHIHSIHHRARVPYPIEFIYVHPLEWMGGMLGLVLGVIVVVLGFHTLNAYVLWSYTAYRTLRELEIHSNLEPKLLKFTPFLCSAKHHSLHHNRVRGNFASAFTYLDRLFGTELRS